MCAGRASGRSGRSAISSADLEAISSAELETIASRILERRVHILRY
jgi:hypothetical protein